MGGPRRLSSRLEAVASLVPEGCYPADIGSDHAFLPISLVQRGKVPYAQAVDNKMGPFMRMKAHVDEAGLSSKIQLTMADGLAELATGVNCLTICGIGGVLTLDIIHKRKDVLPQIKTIICDPHRDLVKVRRDITALGYYISDEKMVYEDKIYYSIIRFDKGAPEHPYDALDLAFGPINRKKKEPVYLDWISATRKMVSDQLNKNLPPERREYYLKLYRALSSELKGTANK